MAKRTNVKFVNYCKVVNKCYEITLVQEDSILLWENLYKMSCSLFNINSIFVGIIFFWSKWTWNNASEG